MLVFVFCVGCLMFCCVSVCVGVCVLFCFVDVLVGVCVLVCSV